MYMLFSGRKLSGNVYFDNMYIIDFFDVFSGNYFQIVWFKGQMSIVVGYVV